MFFVLLKNGLDLCVTFWVTDGVRGIGGWKHLDNILVLRSSSCRTDSVNKELSVFLV
jgi:hypothetical protein